MADILNVLKLGGFHPSTDAKADEVIKFLDERKDYYRARLDYLSKVRDARDNILSKSVTPLGSKQSGQVSLDQAGFEFVITNEARTLFHACVRMLSSGHMPTYRLPVMVNDDTAEDKMNKAERLVIGAHREIDRHLMSWGHEALLRELAHYVCQGWYAVYPHVEKDPFTGQPQFRLEVYDPIQVYPLWGSNLGLLKVARVYESTLGSVEDMLPREKYLDLLERAGGDTSVTLEIVSYWEKTLAPAPDASKRGPKPKRAKKYVVSHGMVINGSSYWVKPMTEEDVPDIPVLVGVVNGYPERAFETSGSNRSDLESHFARFQGQSVLDNNLDIYQELDRAMSLIMQHISQSALGTTFIHSDEPLGFDESNLGAGAVIQVPLETRVTQLSSNPVPQALSTLVEYLVTSMQKGSLPPQAFGILPFEISGFTLSQIVRLVHNFLAPQILAMQRVIGDSMAFLLQQFRDGDFKDVDLDVRVQRGVEHSSYIVEKFGKKDVPQVLYLDVRLPLSISNDLMQRVEAARGLSDASLVTRQTIWEQILSDIVPDYELEYERWNEDRVMELPETQMMFAVERARQKAAAARDQSKRATNDDDKRMFADRAIFYSNMATKLEQALELRLMGGGEQGPGRQPAGRRGTAPEALPAEAGVVNPDVLRAMLGAGPTPAGGGRGTPSPVRQAIRTARTGGQR